MVCPYSLVKSGHVSEALIADRSKLGRSRNELSVVPEVAATMQAEDRVLIKVGGSLFVTYSDPCSGASQPTGEARTALGTT